MVKQFLLGACLAGCAVFHAGASVRLPAVIASHMVLQRQTEVPLWGHATARHRVVITTSWDQHHYMVTADGEGAFHASVRTPAAGGPYRITFDDGSPLTLTDILIGEVWVCSGQSNMEISLEGYGNQPVLHSNRILATSSDPGLRLFHVERAVANDPRQDCKGDWEAASPGSVHTFSAVGYLYARMLRRFLKVPVGIIEASWGGTPIEAWMDRQSLLPFGTPGIPLKGDTSAPDRLRATCLYNGMIAPVAGYGIRGFIWYQGETNAGRPSGYDKLMEAMVGQWRQVWHSDSLPFYFVQIAPWNYGRQGDSVPYLREAQQSAAHEIPRSGMVVSVDAGKVNTIHPPNKTVIARRLFYWALGDTYHQEGISFRSPEFATMQVKDSVVTVRFTETPHGLTSWDKPITGFEVAGADHVFHPAEARIHGNGVAVSCSDVVHPLSVRYCFKDWAPGNLYNTAGLPVAPFRTDDW
jgi:sialate O-acetylesterase